MVSHNSSVNFDLWIQNRQWNRYQIPVDCLGLDTYVTLSAEDEAALVVVGHCVILQKSMDSTGAKTQGELRFSFILSTVSRDCDTAQIRSIKSMGYYPSEATRCEYKLMRFGISMHIDSISISLGYTYDLSSEIKNSYMNFR